MEGRSSKACASRGCGDDDPEGGITTVGDGCAAIGVTAAGAGVGEVTFGAVGANDAGEVVAGLGVVWGV